MATGHEQKEITEAEANLRQIFEQRKTHYKIVAVVKPHEEEAAPAPEGWKRISFIRHGEGYHNMAQKNWRDLGKPGEPYTLETDAEWRYLDPELTATGRLQARGLVARAEALDVELIVTSTMRRATQTALIACNKAVDAKVPVIALDDAHEVAGKHTCDKRLSVTALKKAYPVVDYSQVTSEEDPFWGDGYTRETPEGLADRAGAVAMWVLQRPEKHIAIAAHSQFLVSFFNAAVALEPGSDEAGLRKWFETGEMRTVLLAPRSADAREGEGGCVVS